MEPGNQENTDSVVSALAILFDLLPHGAVMLTIGGRILAVNRIAQRIIALEDGLQVSGGTLTTASPYHARMLRQFLRNANQPKSSAAGLTIPRANHPPWRAALLPVALLPASEPAILMLLSDSDADWNPDENLLRQMFTLTRAESKVAALIMCGKSIEDSAAELGISDSTVRNHLKRIFAKTRTRRQGELVSLLLRSPARFTPGHAP